MWFIGDCHGRLHSYQHITDKLILPGGQKGMDCSLQVGDFGIFDEKDLIVASRFSPQHRFFCGNHDNRQLCHTLPNHIGDFGYLPDLDLFWLSGGYSIDKDTRTIGEDWWEDEELSWHQLHEAIDLYRETQPRYMVSHEAPTVAKNISLTKLAGRQYKGEINSRTENALQTMFESHQPEVWIYGHFHVRVEENVGRTHFVGLNDNRGPVKEQIFEIPGLSWD